MISQLKSLLSGHGLYGILALWALREAGPKIWSYVSTTGTDSVVNKAMSYSIKALKNHGATDDEIAAIVSGFTTVLNRVAADVQQDSKPS